MLDLPRLSSLLRTALTSVRRGRAAMGDERALHEWLVLSMAAFAASARQIVEVPDLHAIEARDATSAARSIDDALSVLGVSPKSECARATRGRAAQVLLGASGGLATWAALDESALGVLREDGMALTERRARGAHATPSSWASALAASGLDAVAPAVTARGSWLEARVVDPAAGGGALLVAAGQALLERERRQSEGAAESPTLRREIVERCLFGVELDEGATRVARAALALWGATRGAAAPRVRHVACGDPLLSREVDDLLALDPAGALERRDDALARDTCDGLVDAHFSHEPMKRGAERRSVIALARRARLGDVAARAELARRGETGRTRGGVHPRILWRRQSGDGFDLALMNPPFLGGKRIGTVLGAAYADWLLDVEPHATGNADLAAHFLLAARRWLAAQGAVAVVATNTLAEGATRDAGLAHLVEEGFRVVSATRGERWPGRAAVSVVRVVLSRGDGDRMPSLDGEPVAQIDAGLRAATVRPAPMPLDDNRGLGFIGCYVRGDGFLVERAEAQALLDARPALVACLRPYLIGEDVMRRAERMPSRWVIDFERRSLDEARAFPELLAIVEARVRPGRMALPASATNRAHRASWWRFANVRAELRASLQGQRSCLVAARVAKHLIFTHADAAFVFSEQLVVVSRGDDWLLAVLNSRVHRAWARAHSSSLQEGLRYLPSRALVTFPLPIQMLARLTSAGASLRTARDRAASALGIGLSVMRDRTDAGDEALCELRAVEADVEREVLAAYGWTDLEAARPPSATARAAWDARIVERLADENTRRARRGRTEGALV